MLTTISQPIWILVGVIAIADICLMCWCLALIRRSRKADRRHSTPCETATLPEQWTPSNHFQQNLICLQIDAVFDSLAALIDTERIKLKSLLSNMATPDVNAPRANCAEQGKTNERPILAAEQPATISQQIVQFAAAGEKPAGIANQMGISLAEVELAMKMQAARRSPAGRKLEAVA